MSGLCAGRRMTGLQRETLLPMGLVGRYWEASLGKLVKFDQRQRAVKGSAVPVAGNAQILMFTGVRYERGTLVPPDTRLDPTRPKRKRG